ncbi:M48 family metallopeptidase [Candidatus Woesearchaeota archaeon]|nr:M48 family metallopeptidase [Candidatus Woesearchaeota archaeon]
MDLVQEAYQRLFPDKEFSYQSEINYNLKLADFNANIHSNQQKIAIHLNLQWKDIDDEIKIGLIQSLLLKLFRKKISTPNIELYNNFIKNIPLLTQKNRSDPLLETSFQRVNERFFYGCLEKTNLAWGMDAKRKLASYNFHNDTITVSALFKNAPEPVLDYIMYHEMLHKHQKFTHNEGRCTFHTKEFRRAEQQFPDQKQIEKEISNLLRSQEHFLSHWNWKSWFK